MMKKISLIILSLVTIFSVLSGCGSTYKITGKNTQSEEKTTESATQSEEKTTESTDEAVESKPDYSAFAGNYEDKFSQRAYAQITESADKESCHITVHWSSSALEYTEWQMTGIWADEKLSYTDCICRTITTEEDKKENVKTEYENGKGYFTFDGQTGNLSWVGAADEDCRSCVFEKYNGEID